MELLFKPCFHAWKMIFLYKIEILFQIEECMVCSDQKASVLFTPCQHMNACTGRFTRTGTTNLHNQQRHRLVASCQLYWLVATRCEQVAKNLSNSSSCKKSVKMRLVATCYLQNCSTCNLKKLVASPWITSFDNQLATSLLTTCNRLFVNKLSQAMRTHSDIGLLITRLLLNLKRPVANCMFLTVELQRCLQSRQ